MVCACRVYVKDNYCARFHDPSFYRYRERHLKKYFTPREILTKSMEREM